MTMNCRGCGTPQERCKGDCCPPCHTNKTLHHSWGRKETPPTVMTPERLADIREITENAPRYALLVNGALAVAARHRKELLAYVDELTRQRDDARALAVKSGIFQDHFAEVYPQAHDEQPLVGAVAWDKQEQQR